MSVKVVARLRPVHESEADIPCIVTTHTQNGGGEDAVPTVVRIPNPRSARESFSFQFNRVFEAQTTQKQLFDAEIRPTVKHLFLGYDVTLFAYGVTGTGKTHTMRGGKALDERGIIPRLLSAIYRQSRSLSTQPDGDTEISISLSYYEIYNDKVYDLFEPPEKRTFHGLPLRDNGSRTVVVGLSERPCRDLETFEKLYEEANANRSTSATKLNAHSSRSHAILCVKLSIKRDGKTTVSTASCIDLAGSEDNRRTDNRKERLVESSAINKSLFVLGQCVEAMNRGQQRIPYRESKMTRILALGQNNGLCICLLNLCPLKTFHLDTLSSLHFANRTKKVEVKEVKAVPRVPPKTTPRPSYAANTVTGVRRQALQRLSSITQNIQNKKAAPEPPPKPSPKLGKSFGFVRKDDSKPRRMSSVLKLASPTKRDSGNFTSSIPKASAPEPGPKPSAVERISKRFSKQVVSSPGLSEAAIEVIVERKVNEILAARALEAPAAPPQPEISEELRRRLEALEQKIEAHGREDERAEGLSFLLMAKQHVVRGEDKSALKMYELAREYFPDNKKLEAKIVQLRKKTKSKRLSRTQFNRDGILAPLIEDILLDETDEGGGGGGGDGGSAVDTENTTTRNTTERDNKDEAPTTYEKPVFKSSLPRPFSDEMAVLTPRGQRLMEVMETREALQARANNDVDMKKARMMVEAV